MSTPVVATTDAVAEPKRRTGGYNILVFAVSANAWTEHAQELEQHDITLNLSAGVLLDVTIHSRQDEEWLRKQPWIQPTSDPHFDGKPFVVADMETFDESC